MPRPHQAHRDEAIASRFWASNSQLWSWQMAKLPRTAAPIPIRFHGWTRTEATTNPRVLTLRPTSTISKDTSRDAVPLPGWELTIKAIGSRSGFDSSGWQVRAEHLLQPVLRERKVILEELQAAKCTIEKIVIHVGSNFQPPVNSPVRCSNQQLCGADDLSRERMETGDYEQRDPYLTHVFLV